MQSQDAFWVIYFRPRGWAAVNGSRSINNFRGTTYRFLVAPRHRIILLFPEPNPAPERKPRCALSPPGTPPPS